MFSDTSGKAFYLLSTIAALAGLGAVVLHFL